MPTVHRWRKYRASFFSNDRSEPPHVHVTADGHQLKIWLESLVVAVNSGFPAHEIGDILEEISFERNRLIEEWNVFFGL
jgi:hypothetical protein